MNSHDHALCIYAHSEFMCIVQCEHADSAYVFTLDSHVCTHMVYVCIEFTCVHRDSTCMHRVHTRVCTSGLPRHDSSVYIREHMCRVCASCFCAQSLPVYMAPGLHTCTGCTYTHVHTCRVCTCVICWGYKHTRTHSMNTVVDVFEPSSHCTLCLSWPEDTLRVLPESLR